MKYVFDSYAWIEYLDGSSLGEKVNEILLDDDTEIFSLNLTIAEVVSRTKRKKRNVELAFKAIHLNSKVLEVTPEIAKKAGLFHAEVRKKIKDFGIVDALILVFSRELNARILTGDEHFESFKEAVML